MSKSLRSGLIRGAVHSYPSSYGSGSRSSKSKSSKSKSKHSKSGH